MVANVASKIKVTHDKKFLSMQLQLLHIDVIIEKLLYNWSVYNYCSFIVMKVQQNSCPVVPL
jgi:hypothetical protein